MIAVCNTCGKMFDMTEEDANTPGVVCRDCYLDDVAGHDWPPPCVHGNGRTLCADCQAAYDYDPESYIEYGDHPAGLERWRELQEEIAAGAALPTTRSIADPDIPF